MLDAPRAFLPTLCTRETLLKTIGDDTLPSQGDKSRGLSRTAGPCPLLGGWTRCLFSSWRVASSPSALSVSEMFARRSAHLRKGLTR